MPCHGHNKDFFVGADEALPAYRNGIRPLTRSTHRLVEIRNWPGIGWSAATADLKHVRDGQIGLRTNPRTSSPRKRMIP
jgi:hypothetical protein